MSGLAALRQCNFTFNTHLFANIVAEDEEGPWPGTVGSCAQYYGSATQYLPPVIYHLFHGNSMPKLMWRVSVFKSFLSLSSNNRSTKSTRPRGLACSVFCGVPWERKRLLRAFQPLLITRLIPRGLCNMISIWHSLAFVCLRFHCAPAPTASLVPCHPIWGCLTS